MKRRLNLRMLIAVFVGASPLVTVGTCDETGGGAYFTVRSTNNNLVSDVLDLVFDEDDDD